MTVLSYAPYITAKDLDTVFYTGRSVICYSVPKKHCNTKKEGARIALFNRNFDILTTDSACAAELQIYLHDVTQKKLVHCFQDFLEVTGEKRKVLYLGYHLEDYFRIREKNKEEYRVITPKFIYLPYIAFENIQIPGAHGYVWITDIYPLEHVQTMLRFGTSLNWYDECFTHKFNFQCVLDSDEAFFDLRYHAKTGEISIDNGFAGNFVGENIDSLVTNEAFQNLLKRTVEML